MERGACFCGPYSLPILLSLDTGNSRRLVITNPDELKTNSINAVKALQLHDGNATAAADHLSIARSTFRDRIAQAKADGVFNQIMSDEAEEYPDWSGPDLPSEQPTVEELLDWRSERFEKTLESNEARDWMEFKINIDGPIGLAFVGDPHLDSNGCNIPLLRRDVEILQETEGLYGIGLGDYTNNWSGRLAQKLSPHQETTRKQAWILAEWFFGAVPWFLLIKGNHDLWSVEHGTGDPLDYMFRGAAPLEDWQARFKITFKNGREYKIWASHDFPGNSIYNPLHSNMRMAKFSGAADLYISGHTHNYACFEYEDAERHQVYWACRARGYKYIDSYGEKLGHRSQRYGATITAIFDPFHEGNQGMRCFSDLEEAAEFLEFKRGKWKNGV